MIILNAKPYCENCKNINPVACQIKKVIFNDPVTVVIWKDKTKTVVRARNEPFDPEKGLAMAIVKYINHLKKNTKGTEINAEN